MKPSIRTEQDATSEGKITRKWAANLIYDIYRRMENGVSRKRWWQIEKDILERDDWLYIFKHEIDRQWPTNRIANAKDPLTDEDVKYIEWQLNYYTRMAMKDRLLEPMPPRKESDPPELESIWSDNDED